MSLCASRMLWWDGPGRPNDGEPCYSAHRSYCQFLKTDHVHDKATVAGCLDRLSSRLCLWHQLMMSECCLAWSGNGLIQPKPKLDDRALRHWDTWGLGLANGR